DDAGAFRARAVKIIEIDRVRRRFGAAHRGQANPKDRHALAFEGGDRLIDALGINLSPLIGAKLSDSTGLSAGLCLRCSYGGLLFARLFLVLRFLFGSRFVRLILLILVILALLFFGFLGGVTLPDRLPVADAKHH